MSSAKSNSEGSSSAEMTSEQLAEAKRYGRLSLCCDLADRALDVAFLAVMAFVVAVPLDAWLQTFPLLAHSTLRCTGHDALRLIALFVLTYVLHLAVSFPLSFFAGFTLERRFGLSRLSPRGWLWRYAKRNLLGIAFGAAMFSGLYAIIWATGPWWWLLAAGAFFLVSIALGQLAPVLILPLFYKIERLDDPQLAARLARLTEGTGLSLEGVYRMDLSSETAKANAMLTGLGRTRRVIFGDTLLQNFTPEEIEVIFAHEVGHHVFRHIRKMILAGAFYCTLGFWLCDWFLMSWVRSQFPNATQHDLPVWTLPMLMLVITLFSLLMEPLQNAVSRHFERQCDRYALATTGLREAYLSAFRKLARLNKDDPDPHALEVLLFHSHPPIRERLEVASTSRARTPAE